MTLQEKMGPRKDEGSYWGYEEQGKGSYKASRVFNLSQTTLQNYVKDWRESLSEAIKQNWVGRKCLKENMIWLSSLLKDRKFLGLTMTDFVCLSYQLAVRNGIKTKMWLKINVIRKFLLQLLKVFTLKSEGFHSWISSSVFFNLWTRNGHQWT